MLSHHRFSILLLTVSGLAASVLGWTLGGLAGSFAPRTIGAVAGTAIAVGLFCHQRCRPRGVLLGAAVSATTAFVAFQVGRVFISPLIAFPVAALVIALLAAFPARGLRAKIVLVAAAPVFGTAGFLVGMAGTSLIGMVLNDSRVASQVILGGAAGFGLFLSATLGMMGRRQDRIPEPGEVK